MNINHIVLVSGLETCKWPGRNQKVVRSGVTFYIDGAHTVGSVQVEQKMFNLLQVFFNIPSNHFGVLQTFDRKHLAKVKK